MHITTMHITTTDVALLKLLQLCSATFPVGAYAFSHGLESAVDSGWINNAERCKSWLHCQLAHSFSQVDLPIMLRMTHCFSRADFSHEDAVRIAYWNNYLLASRETKELALSDLAMGKAIVRLLDQQGSELKTDFYFQINQAGDSQAINRQAHQEPTFLLVFCWLAVRWQIPVDVAALGYTWSWLENQVAAATKLVPLGQMQAQNMLNELQEDIPIALAKAKTIQDEDIGSSLPALAIASAWHETQYSRLFRS